jgi:ABC-type branched-subunit amino acid transport system substrate-binding protein
LTRLVPYLVILVLALPFRAVSQEQIAIGLLLLNKNHTGIIEAAQLAIDQANAEPAYKDQEFKLVIRTAEGFWGAGSKESVSLVYEDQVRAIIGSLDGRNGHLAEQVAAKSHLTYIETYATDPTLSQAFVPWFMRVVPNDNQQSLCILKQIEKEGGGKIGILSIETYDTRYAVKSFTKAVAGETGMAALVFDLDTTGNIQGDAIEKILDSNIDHLVLPFDASYLKDLIMTLSVEKPDLKIYGTLHFSMGLENRKDSWDSYEGIYMVSPHLDRDKYSALPNSQSAYMYDAVNLVINAIQQVGCEREAITDYISKSDYSKGITGSISFDELGNRQGASTLIRIKNGVPQLIDHP